MGSGRGGMALPVQRRRRRAAASAIAADSEETPVDTSSLLYNESLESDDHGSSGYYREVVVNPKSTNSRSSFDGSRRSCRRSSSMPVSEKKASEEATACRSRRISERSRFSSFPKRSSSNVKAFMEEEEELDFSQEKNTIKRRSLVNLDRRRVRGCDNGKVAGSSRPNKKKMTQLPIVSTVKPSVEGPESSSSIPSSPVNHSLEEFISIDPSSCSDPIESAVELPNFSITPSKSIFPVSEAECVREIPAIIIGNDNADASQQGPSPDEVDLHRTEEKEKSSSVQDTENFTYFSRKNITTYQVSLDEHGRLQYAVDVMMWKDTSRSALLFGLGAFCILSTSYARDFHFSLVSLASYMGLVYLAAVFFYKRILGRGIIEYEFSCSSDEIIKETDVVLVLRSILPVINDMLAKFRKLFSGDPVTTIKLALGLWFFAQCGHRMSLITLLKICFFASFTIPKLYASYSSQLHTHGNFMVCRFQDAWNSCSHKKGVVLGISFMAWNLSTVSTRIWGAFILIVAFYLYHQSSKSEQKSEDVCDTQAEVNAISGNQKVHGAELEVNQCVLVHQK